jgi:hypothetical protein
MKTKTRPQSKILLALTAILCCVISFHSFGQNPCDAPTGLNSTGLTTSAATLSWTVVPGAVGYNVMYQEVGSLSPITISTATESVTISSLNASTNYEWQVQTDCGNSNLSAVSASATFSTPASVCSVPAGLNTTGITLSDATMNWTIVPGAVGYNIQYRLVGAPSWTSSSSWTLSSATTASLTVSSLIAGSYEWQVQTDCGNSYVSGFSAVDNFSPLAQPVCNTPTGLNVTGVTLTDATLNWTTDAGAQGYNVHYRSSGSATWIDLYSTTPSLALSSLTPATSYECQVQIVCAGGAGKSYFCKPASFNTLSASGCNVVPSALSAVSSSSTSALLSWTGGVDNGTGYAAYSYVIQYRVAGTQTWSITNSSVPSVTLSGLSPVSYEWMVSTDCGNSNNRSAFSAMATFSMSSLLQNVNSHISTVPNASNPSTHSAMFQSSGNAATDAQIVHDWLAAHGIY